MNLLLSTLNDYLYFSQFILLRISHLCQICICYSNIKISSLPVILTPFLFLIYIFSYLLLSLHTLPYIYQFSLSVLNNSFDFVFLLLNLLLALVVLHFNIVLVISYNSVSRLLNQKLNF